MIEVILSQSYRTGSLKKENTSHHVMARLDDALMRLRANDDTLTKLNLGNANIDAKGVGLLVDALKVNDTLTELNL